MATEEGVEPSAPAAEDVGASSASAPAPPLPPLAPAASGQVPNTADMAKAAAVARALQTRAEILSTSQLLVPQAAPSQPAAASTALAAVQINPDPETQQYIRPLTRSCKLSRSLPKRTLSRLAKCHKQWQKGLRLCKRSFKLSFNNLASPTVFQQGAVNRAGGEKGLPLNDGIKIRPIPPQFKFPPVPRYSGETDPKEFLSIYESAIEVAHGDENTKAKAEPANQGQPPRQVQAPITWRKFRTDHAGKAVMAVEEVQALRKEFDAQQASNHQQPIRKKVQKNLYCAFHGRSLHTTEQCRNIRQRGNAQDPRPQQGAAAEAPCEAVQEQAPPAEQCQDVQRKVIQVITRADPPSQLSKWQKKIQLRTVHNITSAGEGAPQYLNQQISFGPEDAEGVMFPHQDPLVISAEIAGFEVRRGYSADVIFTGAYAKMGLPTLALTQAPASLHCFSGEAVQVLGQAQLLVAFGTGENRREEQI
uniref:Polyprotein n=2 Tax=Oryza sativa subsp. japonica TaxID=39947 RepID=Q10IK8_ORYSJ|nr:putative polyprotein [Oryza sativa Japonica Group]ABF96981.1 hypothetical protein LOC_Os03g33900 [Oryza sativa Japonica Group]